MSLKKIIILSVLAAVLIPAYIIMLMLLESWMGRVLVFIFTAISVPAIFRKSAPEPEDEKWK